MSSYHREENIADVPEDAEFNFQFDEGLDSGNIDLMTRAHGIAVWEEPFPCVHLHPCCVIPLPFVRLLLDWTITEHLDLVFLMQVAGAKKVN
jgi:hypothetical protein